MDIGRGETAPAQTAFLLNTEEEGLRALLPGKRAEARIQVVRADNWSASMLSDLKRFEILFESLKDAYKEHMDMSLKICGILLVVLGWFVSSKNPLSMLCAVPALAYFALAFVVMGQVALAYLFLLLRRRGQEVYSVIRQVEPNESLYARYRVSAPMVAGSLFGQLTMLIGIFFLIHSKYINAGSTACLPIPA